MLISNEISYSLLLFFFRHMAATVLAIGIFFLNPASAPGTFDFLFHLSIYHLHNLQENKRIRIKLFVTKQYPQVDSITRLFSGANWMERETFDFYGVKFIGHPNLIRILNVEYMDYHPMRKEYPLEDATREDKDDKFFGR